MYIDNAEFLKQKIYTQSIYVQALDESASTSGCPSANQNECVEFSKPTRHLSYVLTKVDEEEDVVCLLRI